MLQPFLPGLLSPPDLIAPSCAEFIFSASPPGAARGPCGPLSFSFLGTCLWKQDREGMALSYASLHGCAATRAGRRPRGGVAKALLDDLEAKLSSLDGDPMCFYLVLFSVR